LGKRTTSETYSLSDAQSPQSSDVASSPDPLITNHHSPPLPPNEQEMGQLPHSVLLKKVNKDDPPPPPPPPTRKDKDRVKNRLMRYNEKWHQQMGPFIKAWNNATTKGPHRAAAAAAARGGMEGTGLVYLNKREEQSENQMAVHQLEQQQMAANAAMLEKILKSASPSVKGKHAKSRQLLQQQKKGGGRGSGTAAAMVASSNPEKMRSQNDLQQQIIKSQTSSVFMKTLRSKSKKKAGGSRRRNRFFDDDDDDDYYQRTEDEEDDMIFSSNYSNQRSVNPPLQTQAIQNFVVEFGPQGQIFLRQTTATADLPAIQPALPPITFGTQAVAPTPATEVLTAPQISTAVVADTFDSAGITVNAVDTVNNPVGAVDASVIPLGGGRYPTEDGAMDINETEEQIDHVAAGNSNIQLMEMKESQQVEDYAGNSNAEIMTNPEEMNDCAGNSNTELMKEPEQMNDGAGNFNIEVMEIKELDEMDDDENCAGTSNIQLINDENCAGNSNIELMNANRHEAAAAVVVEELPPPTAEPPISLNFPTGVLFPDLYSGGCGGVESFLMSTDSWVFNHSLRAIANSNDDLGNGLENVVENGGGNDNVIDKDCLDLLMNAELASLDTLDI